MSVEVPIQESIYTSFRIFGWMRANVGEGCVLEGRYHALVTLEVAIALVENNGRVLYVSPKARYLLEKDAEKPAEQVIESLFTTAPFAAAVKALGAGDTDSQLVPLAWDQARKVVAKLEQVTIDHKECFLLVLDETRPVGEVGYLSMEDAELILNGSPDEIFVTDGQGYTLWVNDACKRLYNMKAEELIGRHVSELEREGIFFPSVTPHVLEKRDRVSLIQNTKSGRKIALTANPIFDEQGNIIRIVTNSKDITELMDLYRQLAETREAIERLREGDGLEPLAPSSVVFKSKVMQEVMGTVNKVAPRDVTVLLLGESGTGKDTIARIIHDRSKRRKGPFIKVNCAAIPESLLESELFGYDPGAFTGARKQGKPGLFELAHEGTILLNEISEIPLNLQVKLLQVIQDRQLVRVGGTRVINLDVRIISASNKNLKELVEKGLFREDLFFRINVVPLYIPPLRERKEDIPELIWFYLNRFNKRYGVQKDIATEVVEVLTEYSWPGNIRELQNLIERLVVISEGERITLECLPNEYLNRCVGQSHMSLAREPIEQDQLRNTLASVEKEILLEAYQKYRSTYKVARVLGVSQPTVVRKLRKYGLTHRD